MYRPGHEDTWKEPDDVETDVQEVWFAGGHCDVGGGNVKNDEKHAAANIPLRWMVREVFRCNTGILWDIAQLKKFTGLDADKLHPEVIIPLPYHERAAALSNGSVDLDDKHKHRFSISNGLANLYQNLRHEDGSSGGTSRSFSTGTIFEDLDEIEDDTSSTHPDGVEHVRGMRVYDDDEMELRDATSRLFDQLAISPIWWILEFFPVKGRKQIQEDIWKEHYFINLGRGRIVPKLSKGMFIHRSVKLRLKSGSYKSKAIYDQEPTWIL